MNEKWLELLDAAKCARELLSDDSPTHTQLDAAIKAVEGIIETPSTNIIEDAIGRPLQYRTPK